MSTQSQLININDFIRLQRIGYGGFGEVYKIQNKKTSEIYAAKIFYKSIDISSVSPEVIDLSREVNILSKTNYPTIIKLIGYSPVDFNNESKPVLIFEFLENLSLARILDLEKRALRIDGWNDTQKLIILYGIAAGMKYLHDNRIIHRDLKTLNILVDKNCLPKIADFGLAKIMHTNQWSMTIQSKNDLKGTIVYLAPEIIESNNYSKASDVYAFGMIMYEVMNLETPFENYNQLQIPTKVLDGVRPTFKKYIPESYKNLTERCWNHDPEKRPTFDEIINEFRNDPNFIFGSIDECEFFDFVDFLDEYQQSFDDKKRLIDIDLYIQKRNKTKSRFSWFSNFLSFFKIEIQPKIIYPAESYSLLDENCQNLVKESINDPQKQFIIGKYLINGENNFPLDLGIASKYFEESIKNGCSDAAYFYSKMLFNGEIFKKNIEKAKKILSKFLKKDDFRIHFLYAKIMKKQNNYSEALKYFELAAKSNDIQSMYECAKLLYNGNGGKQNVDEALQYYRLSSQNGCKKSFQFLNHLKSIGPNNNFRKIPLGTQQFLISQKIKFDNDPKNAMNNKFELVIEEKHLRMLDNNHSFENSIFIIYLKKIERITINMNYSYFKFAEIINKINKMNVHSIGINLHISNCKKLNKILGPSELFSTITIDPSVTSISERVFGDLSKLIHITIPSSINIIEKSLFIGCSSIQYIEIPSSVTEIKDNAFENCRSLKGITIPNSVNSIGDYAFRMCTSMKNIAILSSVISLGSYVFEGCNSLILTIQSQYVSIGYSTFKKSSINQIICESSNIIDSLKNIGYSLLKYNKSDACNYFKLAAKCGNIESMKKYAEMLRKGEGIPINKEESLKYYKMAADKGDVSSMYLYAYMQYKGDGIKINKTEALKYFKLAADKGDIPSMYSYAYMLYIDDEIIVNKPEAFEYFKLAANKNNQRSMYYYAYMLYNGDGIEVNKPEACKYFKLAADKGDIPSMYSYAYMLYKSDGVKVNKPEALKYFKRAVDRGDASSMYYYAYMLYNGDGIEVNKPEACKYFKRAADKGDARSMYNYANMLYKGDGVEINKSEACKYYQLAAYSGNECGMYDYALLILNGDCIENDLEKKSKFLKHAAMKGNTKAMYHYAEMLRRGNGVKTNIKKALYYYKMAAEKGFAKAQIAYNKYKK